MGKVKSFVKKYSYAWTLLYVFIYMPWFIWLENHVTTNYHVVYCKLDGMIPFIEYFIVPYLLWFIYIAGGILYFLFFTNKKEYYQLAGFLFSGMTLFLIICTIFPNGQNLRPMINPDKNIFTKLVYILYGADTSTNVFPSIHVYNSIGMHIAIRKSPELRKYKWVQLASLILMISICMATVFLKQHSVIDGLGGIVMSIGFYYCFYGREKKAEVEELCVQN